MEGDLSKKVLLDFFFFYSEPLPLAFLKPEL